MVLWPVGERIMAISCRDRCRVHGGKFGNRGEDGVWVYRRRMGVCGVQGEHPSLAVNGGGRE